MDNEEIDRRMHAGEPRDFHSNLTLTERMKRVEDILCVGIATGCDESILGSVKEEPAWSARGQYVGPRNAEQEATVGKRRYHGGLGAGAGEMPPQQTALEEIMQRIQHCTDRVIGTASRLERIGERVFGPLPEMDNGSGLAKVNPDGTLDHTLLALNWLDGAIARLEMAEARLSGI